MSNSTFNPDDCTLATCSVKEYGQIQYIPNLGANVAYAAIFGFFIIAQLFLGIRYKTWGYLVGMLCGLFLEIIGYAGRLMLNHNIFDNNAFIIYLVGLTIGPAFITASIYLCLGRIITIYGVHLSMLKPKAVTIIFICCDFLSLLLQAIGGALASTADTHQASQTGVNVMIAGLATQVISLFIFSAVSLQFAWKVKKNPTTLNPEFISLRATKRFKGMLFAIALSVLTITVRSIYRLAELQGGFDGALANNEVEFMILEGPMVFIAVLVLTIWHPGYVLGTKLWVDAGFHLRKSREVSKGAGLPAYKEVANSSQEGFDLGSQNRRSPQNMV